MIQLAKDESVDCLAIRLSVNWLRTKVLVARLYVCHSTG